MNDHAIFFRDASILEVAPGQWLLFATGRGRWFSRVDVYQSFDLEEWQYLGAALRSRPGSERNSAFASTESPQVTRHAGRLYLSISYNNGSRLWAPLLLLLRRAPRGREYDDTLVFHSDNPYAGWPWAAMLTSGEVAVAPLAWDRVEASDGAGSKVEQEGVSRQVR